MIYKAIDNFHSLKVFLWSYQQPRGISGEREWVVDEEGDGIRRGTSTGTDMLRTLHQIFIITF